MKKITTIEYQCEVCSRKYETETKANECEAKGAFSNKQYPQGLMLQVNHNGYIGIFAIPHKEISDWGEGGWSTGQHVGIGSYWACRSTKFSGDTLDGDLCGGDYFYSDNKSFKNWNKYHHIRLSRINGPEFMRMVDYLKGKGITPCYYTTSGRLITVK